MATHGLFKFAGHVRGSGLRPGQSTAVCLSDDPSVGPATAQGIAISYPIALPIRVFALAAYLNSSVPDGCSVTFHLLKNNQGTPVRVVFPALSPIGVRTSTFNPPVDFAVGDRLDLAVTLTKESGEPSSAEFPCSATIGFEMAP